MVKGDDEAGWLARGCAGLGESTMFAIYLEASSGRVIRLSRADARRVRFGVAGEDCAEVDARCEMLKFTVGEDSSGDEVEMADFKFSGSVDANADGGCVRLS